MNLGEFKMVVRRQCDLSHDYLLKRLDYNPETGEFTWKPKVGGPRINGRFNGRMAGRVAGHSHSSGYIELALDGVKYYAHRLAWFYTHGEWPPEDIDHIDRDRGNNRVSNLRLATRSQNLRNTVVRPYSKTGVKGVKFCKKIGKYVATITLLGQAKYLGLFDDKESAGAAYREAAAILHGEFARYE